MNFNIVEDHIKELYGFDEVILFNLYIDDNKKICLKVAIKDMMYYGSYVYDVHQMSNEFSAFKRMLKNPNHVSIVDNDDYLTICFNDDVNIKHIDVYELNNKANLSEYIQSLEKKISKLENESVALAYDILEPNNIAYENINATELNLLNNYYGKVMYGNFAQILMRFENLTSIVIHRQLLMLFDFHGLSLPNVKKLTLVYSDINIRGRSDIKQTNRACSIPNVELICVEGNINQQDIQKTFWKSFTKLSRIRINDLEKRKLEDIMIDADIEFI